MSNINTQGFGIQLAPAGFPLEANKIFVNYAAALEFVKTKPAAYVGSIITVSAPSTIDGVTYPKGAYIVDAVGENAVLTQVGKETNLSDYVHKNDVATKGADKVLKTNSDGKIEVDTTGNAATADHATSADSANSAQNAQTAQALEWDNVTKTIAIQSGYITRIGERLTATNNTSHNIIDVHQTHTLHIGDVNINSSEESYFALGFVDSEDYDIISVKSCGFSIPMEKDENIQQYLSKEAFIPRTAVKDVEVVINKK